jgi:hypothetical protein
MADSLQQRYLGLNGYWPLGWSLDSKWLFIVKQNDMTRIFRVRPGEDTIRPFGKLPFEEVDQISLMDGGRKMIGTVVERKTDIWMIENFDPDVTGAGKNRFD